MSLVPKSFEDVVTLTRPAPADYEDKDGNTQTAAANEPRFNYSNGVAQGLLLDASLSETAAINDVPAFNASAGHWIIDADLFNSEPLKGMGLGEVFVGSGKMVVSYSGGTAKVWAGGQAIYTVESYTPAEPTYIVEGGLATIAYMSYKPSAISDADAAALATGDFSVGPYDPLSLFTDGQQGVWYDPSDLSTLFQDSAGTTPVTADGDPVGLMLDKSGNDNHASQSTTAAKPTLTADGLLGDGDDDFMTAPLELSGAGVISFVGKLNSLTQSPSAAFIASGSSGENSFQVYVAGSSVFLAIVAPSGQEAIQGPAQDTGAHVFTVYSDGVATYFRVDGVEYGVAPYGGISTLGQLRLLQNRAGTSNLNAALGDVVVAQDEYDPATVERTEKYLADKHGVPLP